MKYSEAMTAVVEDGKAVFSPTLCGTVVKVPMHGIFFVPRITNRRPITPITLMSDSAVARAATDWELSGVPAGAK